METSDTSTWRVELVNKFNIKDAEDNTKIQKIQKLTTDIETESKDAREKINNGDSRGDTIETSKRH